MLGVPPDGDGLQHALVRWHGEATLGSRREESVRARLLCLARTLIVGFWANVLDFGLLAICLRWLHIDATSSRVIALVVSGALTFIASRSFAFRVQGGSVPQQAGRFLVAELLALPLNLLSFHLCASCAPLAAPEVVSFVANALVFIGFSYPVRKLLVFAVPTDAAARARVAPPNVAL
jgi:putative flippase GtrA